MFSKQTLRRFLAALCIGLGSYETWTVFVRATPTLEIQGAHLQRVEEFGRGTIVSQLFSMVGNGLNRIDVQVWSDRVATFLIRCELSEVAAWDPNQVLTSSAWVSTMKRVSGVEWRPIAVPLIETSNGRIYRLRLQLIQAVPLDDSTDRQKFGGRTETVRVALLVSKENLLGGGALWIADQRQLGSLSLRGYTRLSTSYQRFQAYVGPRLPPPLRNVGVIVAAVLIYQCALFTVVYALFVGHEPGQQSGARDQPGIQ